MSYSSVRPCGRRGYLRDIGGLPQCRPQYLHRLTWREVPPDDHRDGRFGGAPRRHRCRPPHQPGVGRAGCIDVDACSPSPAPSPGAAPVHSVEAGPPSCREIVGRDGFRLVGIMAYEGRSPPPTPPRRRRGQACLPWNFGRRAASSPRSGGRRDLRFVNGGGTGSIESTTAEDVVTEVGAGSGVVAQTVRQLHHLPAPICRGSCCGGPPTGPWFRRRRWQTHRLRPGRCRPVR